MHRRILFSAVGSNKSIDIELEGDMSGISTINQLADFLRIPVSKIPYWEKAGGLIKLAIRGNYIPQGSAFLNDKKLSKFRDVGGVVELIGSYAFRNTQLTELSLPRLREAGISSISYNEKLTIINLPSLTKYLGQSLRRNTAALEIYAPNLTQIGDTTTTGSNDFEGLTSLNILDLRKLKVYHNPSKGYGATASGFEMLKIGCEIRVHIYLATANSGAVHESLRYAKNARGAIIKFYDDNGNYVSTL